MTGGKIGESLARVEDDALLRGQSCFVDDITLPGMVEAAFVRAPHAHALIQGIDIAAAAAVDGVIAVLCLDDLRPLLTADRLAVGLPSPAYRHTVDRPILADEEVAYVGEPVAVVLATSRAIAEDAAQLVDVAYEALPAVADCRDALQPGSATAHSALPDNLVARFDMRFGDLDKAFASASHVLRDSFWQHRGGSHSMECRGGVAVHDPQEDLLTFWSSTQTPLVAKEMLCDLLDRAADTVRVAAPDVGGGFGPKLVFYQEDIVLAAAALLLKRPVKWIEDRREHFIATTQERDQYWDVEIAADETGKILGVRGELIHEHGAYTARGVNIPYGSSLAAVLPYNIDAYALDIKLALTNKVPVTPVRGAGQPQGAFVIERLLDRVASACGLDRAEVRRRNLVRADQMPCEKPLKLRGGTTVKLDSGDYHKTLAMALEKAGWDGFPDRQQTARQEGRYIGQGVAAYVEGTGRGPFESVRVRVDPSGQINVYSGAAAMGQSTNSMLAQIVADQLGGDLDAIKVSTGDSSKIQFGFGGFNSRQAVMAGSSAHAAAAKVRDKAMRVAAALFEVGPDALEWQDGIISAGGASNRTLSLGEAATHLKGLPGYSLPAGMAPGLEFTEEVVIDDMAYSYGAAVAAVEADIGTGDIRVTDFVIAHDCGRIINPMIVEGQILGGVVHGISNTLFERMGYDENAQPVTTNYGEYLLVTATELPRIEILHHETPSPLNALGIKGVGESGVIPCAAAIVGAIENALSPFAVRISQTPVTPVDIVRMIAAAKEGREA